MQRAQESLVVGGGRGESVQLHLWRPDVGGSPRTGADSPSRGDSAELRVYRDQHWGLSAVPRPARRWARLNLDHFEWKLSFALLWFLQRMLHQNLHHKQFRADCLVDRDAKPSHLDDAAGPSRVSAAGLLGACADRAALHHHLAD